MSEKKVDQEPPADELRRLLDEAEAALRAERIRAQEELRRLRRYQDEFLAVLVHDLRNAVMPIANASQILQQTDANTARRQTAQQILARQVYDLKDLVDILGDASQIGRGRIDLAKRPVVLTDVLIQAVAGCQSLFDNRRHTITTTLPAEPIWVLGDPARLMQLFTNLLKNAATFTDRGGRIHLSALSTEEVIDIRIEDTGVGIAPDFLPQVFDLFAKPIHENGGPRPGLGIGLALVHALVELHDGSVRAESEGVGLGSAFLVRLPLLSKAARQRMQSELPVNTLAMQRSRRILVVSADTAFAQEWGFLLRVAGQIVQIVPDVTTAIVAIATFKPEVISWDVSSARVGVRKLMERVRQELVPACVIALANAKSEHARAEGCDAVLAKPLKISDFLQVVAERDTPDNTPTPEP